MRVFLCSNHATDWNRGSSVIIAHNKDQAFKQMEEYLKSNGYFTYETIQYDIAEIKTNRKQVLPVYDGQDGF